MRILHVTRDYPPRSTGGLSTAVAGLVGATNTLGIDNQIVSFDGWRPKSKAPPPSPTPRENEYRVVGSSQLNDAKRFAQEFRPQIVHVHSAMLWGFAHDIAHEQNAKTIFQLHVDQAKQNRIRGIEVTQSSEAQKRALKEADLVVAPSHSTADSVAHGGVHIVTLPFGIERCCKADYSLSRKRKSLLYAARYSDMRGTDRLVELAQKLPGIEIRVAGGIPENSRNQEKWDSQLRTQDNITLLGWLPRPELCEEMKSAKLFIAPCREETFGLSVSEALSHTLPVVAFSVGAIPERLAGGGGVLVPNGDTEAFTNAVQKSLDAPDQLREEAKIVREKQYWEARQAAYLDCYRSVVGSER